MIVCWSEICEQRAKLLDLVPNPNALLCGVSKQRKIPFRPDNDTVTRCTVMHKDMVTLARSSYAPSSQARHFQQHIIPARSQPTVGKHLFQCSQSSPPANIPFPPSQFAVRDSLNRYTSPHHTIQTSNLPIKPCNNNTFNSASIPGSSTYSATHMCRYCNRVRALPHRCLRRLAIWR